MELKDTLQFLRKQNGYSQEELADRIGIARQTVSKWETGQAVPELTGLLLLSGLYGVPVDRIVKGATAIVPFVGRRKKLLKMSSPFCFWQNEIPMRRRRGRQIRPE